MIETWIKIVASVCTATLFCIMTLKSVGAMQQSGYKNGAFVRWLKRKDNMLYNRLSVLALCLALACAITSLCFSFLGTELALLLSGAAFLLLVAFYLVSDRKYALKVPAKHTGRFCRLFAVYWLFTACTGYLFISLLEFLSVWNGSRLYALIAYVPFAVMPMLLPFLLVAANALTGIFEAARNKKFIKKAGQVLDETEIIRVGVVGSYGKTSVKNILATILSEKYAVLATPESYNTPMGVAKTLTREALAGKQVFIAEMGARKQGDIEELCKMVKPNFAVFTGVCPQHIASFKTTENIYAEKSKILQYAQTVCGESLKPLVGEHKNATFAERKQIGELQFQATQTECTLQVGGELVRVKTKLLGNAAVENILLAATLASKMGLSAAEIERGIAKLTPVPHRLELIESGGIYILDDGYNGNIKGAGEALEALSRFEGGKCVVTPGLVECGVLEESLNGELGALIAKAQLDRVILVGETLVGAVKNGYLSSGGDKAKLLQVSTLQAAQTQLKEWVKQGDCVLFLNDLPDVY